MFLFVIINMASLLSLNANPKLYLVEIADHYDKNSTSTYAKKSDTETDNPSEVSLKTDNTSEIISVENKRRHEKVSKDCNQSCTDFINHNGFGQCKKVSRKLKGLICYVQSTSSCSDKLPSKTNPAKFYSAAACKKKGPSVLANSPIVEEHLVKLTDYHTYDQLIEDMEEIIDNHPDIAAKYTIGQSVEGRDLLVMRLTSDATSPRPLLTPMVKFLANIHGNEVVGRELMLGLIRYLTSNYGIVNQVTDLLENLDIHILPSINPDGFEKKTRNNANNADLNRAFPNIGMANSSGEDLIKDSENVQIPFEFDYNGESNLNCKYDCTNWPYQNCRHMSYEDSRWGHIIQEDSECVARYHPDGILVSNFPVCIGLLPQGCTTTCDSHCHSTVEEITSTKIIPNNTCSYNCTGWPFKHCAHIHHKQDRHLETIQIISPHAANNTSIFTVDRGTRHGRSITNCIARLFWSNGMLYQYSDFPDCGEEEVPDPCQPCWSYCENQ